MNVETGQSSREDIIEGDMEISHPDSEKYLGQILSADGKNTKNIEKMRNKGIGIKKQSYTNSRRNAWREVSLHHRSYI